MEKGDSAKRKENILNLDEKEGDSNCSETQIPNGDERWAMSNENVKDKN